MTDEEWEDLTSFKMNLDPSDIAELNKVESELIAGAPVKTGDTRSFKKVSFAKPFPTKCYSEAKIISEPDCQNKRYIRKVIEADKSYWQYSNDGETWGEESNFKGERYLIKLIKILSRLWGKLTKRRLKK